MAAASTTFPISSTFTDESVGSNSAILKETDGWVEVPYTENQLIGRSHVLPNELVTIIHEYSPTVIRKQFAFEQIAGAPAPAKMIEILTSDCPLYRHSNRMAFKGCQTHIAVRCKPCTQPTWYLVTVPLRIEGGEKPNPSTILAKMNRATGRHYQQPNFTKLLSMQQSKVQNPSLWEGFNIDDVVVRLTDKLFSNVVLSRSKNDKIKPAQNKYSFPEVVAILQFEDDSSKFATDPLPKNLCIIS